MSLSLISRPNRSRKQSSSAVLSRQSRGMGAYVFTGIKPGRILFVLGIVLLATGGIFLRVIYLQAKQYSEWSEMALKQNSTAIEIQGARGTVYDRSGRLLAVSVEGLAVGIRPKAFLRDSAKIQEKVEALATALEITPAEVEKQIRSSERFFWIARGANRSQFGKLNARSLPGVDLFPEFSRQYPQGELARMILGQVSSEGRGVAGIELSLDSRLQADKERISVRRDARGRLLEGPSGNDAGELHVPDLSMLELVSPAVATMDRSGIEKEVQIREEGGNISLSIDSTLQGILEEELHQGLQDAHAKRVVGVVMRAETGELLALGQALPQSGEFKREANRFLSPEELRNPIAQDIFEPGSTFKPLVAAMALDQKKVSPNELINCENGHYPVGKYVVHDAHPVATVPFSEVLVRSSNVGIAKVGARLGAEGLREGIEKLGFGKSTASGLPGEQQGLLQQGRWGLIQVATNSFGQGISTTALQLVAAYAALANGGKLLKPSILKLSDAELQELSNSPQVFSPHTAKTITEILVGVTEDEEGTGKKASIEGLKVSGKTGTAQKPRKNGRGYEPDKVFASFIGYVETLEKGKPEHLVMFVGVDEPGVHPRWGGVVAAPVFKRAMERILAHKMTE